MAWTAPKTYSVGELQTAADFNTYIRDNFLIAKDALIAGGSVQMIWYDSLNGKNPVVDGTTHSDWSLCDGGTYNTYATPDLRNRFLVGATDTYAHKATGGATTAAHTHDDGTLTTGDNDADHNHSNPNTSGPSATSDATVSGVDAYPTSAHTHTQAATGLVSANHGHAVDAGATASDATAILPPYVGGYFFMYCPA